MKKFKFNLFNINIPEEWKDRSTVVFVGPSLDGYSPSVTVTKEYLEKKQSSEEYGKLQLEVLQNELSDYNYQLIKEGSFKVSGKPAYQRFHIVDIPETDNEKVKQWQIYLVLKNEAITVTATDLVENFKDKIFSKIINQLEIIK